MPRCVGWSANVINTAKNSPEWHIKKSGVAHKKSGVAHKSFRFSSINRLVWKIHLLHPVQMLLPQIGTSLSIDLNKNSHLQYRPPVWISICTRTMHPQNWYRAKYFQVYAEYRDLASDMTIWSQCIRKFDKIQFKYGQVTSGTKYQHAEEENVFFLFTWIGAHYIMMRQYRITHNFSVFTQSQCHKNCSKSLSDEFHLI